jgi:hypothetical protein
MVDDERDRDEEECTVLGGEVCLNHERRFRLTSVARDIRFHDFHNEIFVPSPNGISTVVEQNNLRGLYLGD